MIYVLFSIVCSVTVSVILKIARRYAVDTRQIIVWNYPVAAILTWWFFRPELRSLLAGDLPWGIYLPLAALLPSVFLALSSSIRFTGIVRTEIAQRLSLFIPLIAAFLIFHEEASLMVQVGIGIGLIAMLCTIGWHRGRSSGKSRASSSLGAWLYPLLVFVGYGVCDVLFKALSQFGGVPYTSSMFFVFLLAMFVAFGFLGFLHLARGVHVSVKAIFWGVALGGFNFANILFYMKAHRAIPENPSIVFTGMNIGVIALGALVGMLFFREKLSRLNVIGLILAILAIVVLSWSQ